MQKNKGFTIDEILSAAEKIHKPFFKTPKITEKQANIAKNFVLNNVNKITNDIIKKIKISNL